MGKAILAKINSFIRDSGGYKVFIIMNIAILVLISALIFIQQSWIKKEKSAIKSVINNNEQVQAESMNKSKELMAEDIKKDEQDGMSASSLHARRKAIFNIEKEIKRADMYFEYGQYEKAAAIYKDLTNVNITYERSDKVFYRLAECYYNLGDFHGALDAYRKVYSNYMDSPYSLHAHLRMGECNILIGNYDEARRVLYALVGQEAKYKKDEDKLKIIEAYYKIADSYVEQAKLYLNKVDRVNLQ